MKVIKIDCSAFFYQSPNHRLHLHLRNQAIIFCNPNKKNEKYFQLPLRNGSILGILLYSNKFINSFC